MQNRRARKWKKIKEGEAEKKRETRGKINNTKKKEIQGNFVSFFGSICVRKLIFENKN